MPDRIAAALDQVERDHHVHILLAIESGSRAWGFPSKDSDWDVRFVYHHTLPHYLSIDPPRDVIETPLHEDLDLGGWDLRKALTLIVASNAVIFEWLASPIIYRHDPAATAALSALALEAAHLPALAYHYDRLARRNWPPSDPGAMRLKDLFYAFRPACCVAWMRRHGTQPPMNLPALMAGLELPDALIDDIHRLKARKGECREADTGNVPETVAAFITTTLAHQAVRAGTWDRTTVTSRADALLRRVLNAPSPVGPKPGSSGKSC